jgi:hypothetical protein
MLVVLKIDANILIKLQIAGKVTKRRNDEEGLDAGRVQPLVLWDGIAMKTWIYGSIAVIGLLLVAVVGAALWSAQPTERPVGFLVLLTNGGHLTRRFHRLERERSFVVNG